jgi:pimeloyl-ACP methyl ester carboxylesterase
MRGDRWKRLLAKEKRFSKTLLTPHIETLSLAFGKELANARKLVGLEGFQLNNGTIFIYGSGSSYRWRWIWETGYKSMSDIDVYENHVFYTMDDPRNEYKTILLCENDAGKELWRKTNVSEQVNVKDGYCYFGTVKDTFDTHKIMRCDAFTGRGEECIMENDTPERYMGVYKDTGNVLYCKSTTWQDSKIWQLEGTTLTPKYANTVWQMTAGPHCAFLTYKEGEEPVAVGEPLKSWMALKPKGRPLWVNIESGHLLMIDEGRQTLYYCEPHKKPQSLYSVIGDIRPNPWGKYERNKLQAFLVDTPTDFSKIIMVLSNSCEINMISPRIPKELEALFPPLEAVKHYAVSADGSKVPYVLVKMKKTKRVAGLLCYVYSSYGMLTPIGWPYSLWAPLLLRDYAIAFCFARGGGDGSAEWTFAGQRTDHIKTVEDFEGVVRASQRLTKIGPDRTIIYGRSAGGLIVGGTTMRHPDGDLMATTYTEVPFVDVLRTTTNMELALSPSSISEFGNPAASPWEFQAALKASPMDALPVDGAPGVFVLARTGLKDQQVSPYEPIKWVQKLRGTGSDVSDPKNKYIFIEPNEYHSYSGMAFIKARAYDLAILYDRLEKKSHARVYKMSGRTRNARNMRKNNKSKKTSGGGKKNNRRRTVRK